ncbi:MAG TPA: hypothetical protein VK545_10175 [Streptomyces sp.]|nr:hypothetical protein [Streptomyces sp.]
MNTTGRVIPHRAAAGVIAAALASHVPGGQADGLSQAIAVRLEHAGLLTCPEAAADIHASAIDTAAAWLESVGETAAAYLLRTCDVTDPRAEDRPLPVHLTQQAETETADQRYARINSEALRQLLALSADTEGDNA